MLSEAVSCRNGIVVGIVVMVVFVVVVVGGASASRPQELGV